MSKISHCLQKDLQTFIKRNARNKPIPAPPLPREELKPHKACCKAACGMKRKKGGIGSLPMGNRSYALAGILGLVTLVIGSSLGLGYITLTIGLQRQSHLQL